MDPGQSPDSWAARPSSHGGYGLARMSVSALVKSSRARTISPASSQVRPSSSANLPFMGSRFLAPRYRLNAVS